MTVIDLQRWASGLDVKVPELRHVMSVAKCHAEEAHALLVQQADMLRDCPDADLANTACFVERHQALVLSKVDEVLWVVRREVLAHGGPFRE